MLDGGPSLGEPGAKRILVIGSPGTGKSTIARVLGDLSGLPVVHLDRLYHDPDERFFLDRPRWRAHLVGTLLEEDLWVMDGHYAATLPQRVAAADAVVYLDYPVRVALAGILRRRRQPHVIRDDMPDGWRERVSFALLWSVVTFRLTEARKVRRLLAAAAGGTTIVQLRSRADADRFLAALRDDPRRVF